MDHIKSEINILVADEFFHKGSAVRVFFLLAWKAIEKSVK